MGRTRRNPSSFRPCLLHLHPQIRVLTTPVDQIRSRLRNQGPNQEATHAYIVHQRKAGHWQAFDEDKVMLGFDSEEAATQAYLLHYDDPRFLGPITAMPMEAFKEKVLATQGRSRMIKAVLFLKASLSAARLAGAGAERGVKAKAPLSYSLGGA